MMFARWTGIAALAVCAAVPCTADASPRAATYRLTDRIPAADGGWDYASIDAGAGKLYIARSNAVTVIDLATRIVTDRLVEAHRSHAVVVLDGGKTLFETDGETGLGRFIAASDGKVLGEVATGTKPDAALFDAVSGRIAVMNGGDGTVALIDPVSRRLVGKVAVGGGLEFAVVDGKGGIFINLEDANAIAHVDLKTASVVARYPLTGCIGPTGLGMAKGRLISACANGVAAISDPAHGKVALLSIGRGPDAVLVDAARGLAFIPCGGSGTLVALSLVDRGHITVAATIPTQIGARTGAIDPRDGRIYLPTARFESPAPGARRGTAIPGSFNVLVVSPAS